jgi:hypothetical protein
MGVSVNTPSLVAVVQGTGNTLMRWILGQGISGQIQALYYPDASSGVDVLPAASGQLGQAQNLATGGYKAFAVAYGNGYVYATHPNNGAISYIDVGKNNAVTTVSTPGRKPTYIATNGPYVYFISGSDLVKASLGNGQYTEYGSVSVSDGASGIAAGGEVVVVTNFANDNVYVISNTLDSAPPQLRGTVAIPNGSPNSVALGGGAFNASYVTVYTGAEGMDPGFVDVIDPYQLSVVKNYQVAGCPTPIAVDPSLAADFVDVGNQCDTNSPSGGSLSRIDTSSGNVTTTPLPGTPNAIAVQ